MSTFWYLGWYHVGVLSWTLPVYKEYCMKKMILIIFLSLSLLSHANKTATDSRTEHVTQILNAYQLFAEEMLSNRTKAFELFETLKHHDTLSGADLDAMANMLVRHLQTLDLSKKYISEYQYLTERDDPNLTSKEKFEFVMISLSAMLIRYDDFLLVYRKFNDTKKLREALNDKNSAYGIPSNVLQDIANTYHSRQQRNDIKKMITFYQENKADYEKDKENDFFLYLQYLIENSPSYQRGFDNTTDNTTDSLKNLNHIALDTGDDALDLLINEISKGFGNTAGLIATRKGKLYGDDAVAARIRSLILPGDILLEKTPFRLTDKLIPGYWGHAAIYIGTEQQLQELGIWEKLDELKNAGDRYFTQGKIAQIRQKITNGKVIVEALRDGVQLNSIEHFLNIDDLAIMHDRNETSENISTRIILALRQLGKDYDFKFDVETSVKIVCSELIYATDIFHKWPTKNTAGIETISPDNIAIKSIEANSTFTLPLLYHDGREITTDKKVYMKGLLDGSIK